MIYELLVSSLTFFAVVCFGAAVFKGRAHRRERILARLRRSEDVGERPAKPPFTERLLRFLAQLGRLASGGNLSAGLREELTRAGFHDRSAPTIFMGAKVFLLVAGVAVSAAILVPLALSGMVKSLLSVLAGVSLFFLPNAIVTYRKRRRKEEVQRGLPDAVDLLEICLSAGMSLDAAWNLVGEKMRQVKSTLSDEMALANLEIHLGASRNEALRRMAARTGAEELASLIAVLGQSERFGTSVGDALRAFSTSLREERTMKAEEAAEKVAVKLLFPLVVFIFPAIIVVLAGPAAIDMLKMLST